jgi:hypothetical protein
MSVYRYRVFCNTDNKFEYWNLYSTDPVPTTCPTNTSHSVDATSVIKIKEISDQLLKIVEEDNPTNGKWRAKGVWLQGATGENIVTNQDFKWDHPVSVLNLQICPTTENTGDYVQLSVIPNLGFGEGVIGVLAATGVSGATSIQVSQAIIDNVYTIDYLTLQLGVTGYTVGPIAVIDKENSLLYVPTALPTTFPPGSTLVKLERFVLGKDDFSIGPPNLYTLGATKIGASYIPKGSIIRVGYKNKTEQSKQMYAIIEYLE